MATKDQISLVKASQRRIKELLEGTGIEARVSYTSADDTLKIVFSKRYKRLGCAMEFTRLASLREVSACSGIIEHIVREMTHEMGPKKAYYTSPETFCAELNALLVEYKRAADDRQLSHCIRVAGEVIHIIIHGYNRGHEFNVLNGKGGRYGVYPLPLGYEAADAYFVDLMDKCTDGGYSRWVAAGMPKKFNPVVRGSMTWSQFLMSTAPRVAWAISPDSAQDNGVEPPLGIIGHGGHPVIDWSIDYETISAVQTSRFGSSSPNYSAISRAYPMPDTLFGQYYTVDSLGGELPDGAPSNSSTPDPF